VFTLFLFLVSVPLRAETDLKIPVEYGEVIYRFNEKSPNQIFIIGISHRDSLTCLNGDNTPRVQTEVYKIGDWLIHNQPLELLLPEGFFKSPSKKTEKKNVNAPEREISCPSLDMKALEERLSDNKTYVNAEMLLKENHRLRLRQVEDKGLYDAVRANLVKFADCKIDSKDYSPLKSNLDHLQDKRTAAMLQKMPEIIEEEFRRGDIKSKKAIFTIGLSHVHKIIGYLNENRITIYSPPSASKGSEDYIAELNLVRENFGVCVIIPKTLAADQKILEMNQLEKIVKQSRAPTPLSSLPLP
jgi:hypothetical protein